MRKLIIVLLLLTFIQAANSQWMQSGLSGIDVGEVAIAPSGDKWHYSK